VSTRAVALPQPRRRALDSVDWVDWVDGVDWVDWVDGEGATSRVALPRALPAPGGSTDGAVDLLALRRGRRLKRRLRHSRTGGRHGG